MRIAGLIENSLGLGQYKILRKRFESQQTNVPNLCGELFLVKSFISLSFQNIFSNFSESINY